MKTKSIGELIHDRVFAEGGTLNVWLAGAKFRKGTTKTIARSLYYPGQDECMAAVAEFVPSPELEMLIRRNAVEVREYLAAVVAAWRDEVEKRDAEGGVW